MDRYNVTIEKKTWSRKTISGADEDGGFEAEYRSLVLKFTIEDNQVGN